MNELGTENIIIKGKEMLNKLYSIIKEENFNLPETKDFFFALKPPYPYNFPYPPLVRYRGPRTLRELNSFCFKPIIYKDKYLTDFILECCSYIEWIIKDIKIHNFKNIASYL